MTPDITVIIPTYNCADRLALTLDTLVRQSLPATQFEVIVVDDGSSDHTEDTVMSYKDKLSIRYFFQEDKGFRAAKARNTGINHAKGMYCFFLDSGVVIDKQVLSLHLESLKRSTKTFNVGFCMGFEELEAIESSYAGLLEQQEFDALFAQLKEDDGALDCRARLIRQLDTQKGLEKYPWLLCWGGHLSGPKASLLEIDGFDENFVRWGGEDVELGLRLHLAGNKFNVIEEALTYHIPHEKESESSSETVSDNCRFIHSKHNLPETELMLEIGWEAMLING